MSDQGPLQFTSYFWFRQINLNDLAKSIFDGPFPGSRRSSLMKPVGPNGKMFIFSFGAVTFLNVHEGDRLKELHELSKLALNQEPPSRPFVESFLVVENKDEKPRVEFSQMYVDALNDARQEVIAGVVGQSAAMEHFEDIVDRIWNKVDVLLLKLKSSGSIAISAGQLHRDIGEAIRMRSEVVRILHLLDRPELIWEDRMMDALFNDLRNNFDLQERFQALEYKLGLIQDTLELLIDTVRDKRFYWLEVSIVALITVEIVMTIMEKTHIW